MKGHDTDFVNLLCYMASSARGLIEEPSIYGPLRLLDATSRLIGVLEAHGLVDDSLTKIRDLIVENRCLVMEDTESFIGLLDNVVSQLAHLQLNNKAR